MSFWSRFVKKRFTTPHRYGNGVFESRAAVVESRRKLNETKGTVREVKRVADQAKDLGTENHFTLILDAAMRARRHGDT